MLANPLVEAVEDVELLEVADGEAAALWLLAD